MEVTIGNHLADIYVACTCCLRPLLALLRPVQLSVLFWPREEALVDATAHASGCSGLVAGSHVTFEGLPRTIQVVASASGHLWRVRDRTVLMEEEVAAVEHLMSHSPPVYILYGCVQMRLAALRHGVSAGLQADFRLGKRVCHVGAVVPTGCLSHLPGCGLATRTF